MQRHFHFTCFCLTKETCYILVLPRYDKQTHLQEGHRELFNSWWQGVLPAFSGWWHTAVYPQKVTGISVADLKSKQGGKRQYFNPDKI